MYKATIRKLFVRYYGLRWYGFHYNRKGTAKLLRNGYMYFHRKNLSEGSSVWERIQRRKEYQCNTKFKLSSLDKFLDEIHEHTHATSQTEYQITKVKAGIKRLAEEKEETMLQILGTELRNISDGVAANLPLCMYVGR